MRPQLSNLSQQTSCSSQQGKSERVDGRNVGRGIGAIEFFNLAKARNVPILAIQEDSLKPGNRYIQVGSAWGVKLLVKRALRCRLTSSFSEDDG